MFDKRGGLNCVRNQLFLLILKKLLMALIMLEPNEIFEHFHSEESTTQLIMGQVIFKCDKVEKILELNEIIATPGNISHTLKNIGTTICVLGCQHGTETNIVKG